MPRMGRNNSSCLHICHSQPTCSFDTPPSVSNHAHALTHPINLHTELTPCAFFFLKTSWLVWTESTSSPLRTERKCQRREDETL
ncbi:hypothetical protein KOW79_016118 [Hemibagrus wyckioides]|uniref:Uncharacterized protein n=1 Tax=Hemibagrus wyckioides TaxID=337641 RepID=A0A9D3NFV8_9TELE|nr:hypothetical protein KOW79_016118 [Hemibagrus wyckioides]